MRERRSVGERDPRSTTAAGRAAAQQVEIAVSVEIAGHDDFGVGVPVHAVRRRPVVAAPVRQPRRGAIERAARGREHFDVVIRVVAAAQVGLAVSVVVASLCSGRLEQDTGTFSRGATDLAPFHGVLRIW